ncbi:uncharacterized protein LOC121419785 isoform X2 [Lytechinus variegatus]|uniref:uncharacterized protein LOC121419785 isoform X2 n=1 Tax=Lytechinus variegatus TaxID=7654 RepID=UPI001BB0FD78|nr:uncharacterized protein LOC121419785 isoform X2 [Lytechinus variegatus]
MQTMLLQLKTWIVLPLARLYYVNNSRVLIYTDTLDSGDRTTIGILPYEEAEVKQDMAKYGSKLFFIRDKLVEYDMMSKSVMIHDNITLSLKVGGTHTFSPQSLRITGIDYTEPVTIVDCPMDISVPISSSSADGTRQVSWTEPSLNAWSNCATLDFLGQGTNGGNFSEGIYNMSYQALDTRGNTDVCNFTVTVMNNDASTTVGSSINPQSGPTGGGTTPCSDGNPPSGNGIKTSCNVLQVATALFITMIAVFM